MKDLIEILTWCRGAGTTSESEFVREHICSIDGISADKYGNYHLTIGENPTILWSCHTDTVTHKIGRQNVRWIGKGVLGLHHPQANQCLGADDGAGLWIMLELIKNKRPGHYVFHRDEEIGGLGSSWLSKNTHKIPKSIKCAIAMDRCGAEDIITHQCFQRTASDVFARSLQAQLPIGMRPDDSGVFTDTANYVDLIGECTNLGVGYERNHGPSETLDTNHLRRLRDSLVMLDEYKLEFDRQPGEMEYQNYHSYGQGVEGWYPANHGNDYPNEVWDNFHGEGQEERPLEPTSVLDMENMVSEAPGVAARLLDELGVTPAEFRAHAYALTGRILGG